LQKFWRGRASAKAMCETEGVPRAILSAKTRFVKSFLRVRTKFLRIEQVSAGSQQTAQAAGGADYSALLKICQVFFAPAAGSLRIYLVFDNIVSICSFFASVHYF